MGPEFPSDDSLVLLSGWRWQVVLILSLANRSLSLSIYLSLSLYLSPSLSISRPPFLSLWMLMLLSYSSFLALTLMLSLREFMQYNEDKCQDCTAVACMHAPVRSEGT